VPLKERTFAPRSFDKARLTWLECREIGSHR
jgi:hypothetical protein